ncbi:MAG: hypothetical protein HUJ26_16990 [Planctomycetaceae bacterium]|nr:hypothetical protein [Planctomycetaceae bacterium]
MSKHKIYGMIDECTDLYIAKENDDGSLTITIEVPRRFANLWLVKLSELTVNDQEIAEYE